MLRCRVCGWRKGDVDWGDLGYAWAAAAGGVGCAGGVEHILHAGDVGEIAILGALREIAPVTAIRGNVDVRGECAELPATDVVELAGRLFYLVHSVRDLDIDPVAAGVAVVVSGHSHKPSIEMKKGVMYLNPGSAGPQRFSLPVTVALVTVVGMG